MPDKGSILQDITIPAGKRVPFSAPFYPDYWLVSLPEAIGGIVKVYRSRTEQSGSWSLTGTGQCSWPMDPVENPQRTIFLENTGILDVDVSIYSSVGLPPASYTPPMSFIRPDSVEIQSQLAFEIANPTIPYQHSYLHIGKYALVAIALNDYTSGAYPNITGVSMGGAEGVELIKRRQAGDSRTSVAGFWWIDYEFSGETSLTITITATGSTKKLYCEVLSFLDGLRTGNVDDDGYQDGGAWTKTLTVLGDQDASRVFSLATQTNYSSKPLTETSGATIWTPEKYIIDGHIRMMMTTRRGKGNQIFTYHSDAIGKTAALVAVEITTT